MPYLSVNQKWVILITVIALIIGAVFLVAVGHWSIVNNDEINPEVTETTEPSTEVNEETTEETTEPTTEPTEMTEVTEYVEPVVYIPETEPAPTNPPETIPPTEAPTEPIHEVTAAPVIEETDPVDIPTEETQSLYSDEEIELLAMAIYMEVGSDFICNDCRRYARDVILNRVADSRYPSTIYGVLTQPGQYSAFGNGVYWPSSANSPYEAHAVERAREIAREVKYGQYSAVYGNGYIYQAQFVQGYEGFWCCTEYYGKG
jgi:spore germination cell wall hydrolase CwlJ-like protein